LRAPIPTTTDNGLDIGEAHRRALGYLLDDDPLTASCWFVECAAMCVCRGWRDLVADDEIIVAMKQ
jgi:hypothetical protein